MPCGMQVGYLLLKSAHALLSWLWSIALPLLLAIWPLVRPVLLALWSYVYAGFEYVAPYFQTAANTASDLVVGVASSTWTCIVETDPVTLCACALVVFLMFAMWWLTHWLKRKGYLDRWKGKWDAQTALWKKKRQASIDYLRQRSKMAASFASAFSFAFIPLSFFGLVLLASHLAPLVVEALSGTPQMLFMGILLPAFRAGRVVRSDKPQSFDSINEWIMYACVGGSIVLTYRILVTIPFMDRLFGSIYFGNEIRLASLLWLLSPSHLTGGTCEAFSLLVYIVNKNLARVPTRSMDAGMERGWSMISMALFFVNSRTREILSDLVHDGYILAFLPFVASPGFMARFGCLGAGLAFPVYKSILRVQTHLVPPSLAPPARGGLGGACNRGKGEAQTGAKRENEEEPQPIPVSVIAPLHVQWLKYWLVYSLGSLAVEANLASVLGYIPFFYHFQLLVIIWLQLPYFRGATWLHDGFYNLILVPEHEVKNKAEAKKKLAAEAAEAAASDAATVGKGPKPGQEGTAAGNAGVAPGGEAAPEAVRAKSD